MATTDKTSYNNKMEDLIEENKNLNACITEQEEALFSEIQKNAKMEKANYELYEQVQYFKMEVADLNQKISYISSKLNCDDIFKDLIYKQQSEILSLKEELSMSKNTSSQLRSRLKSQVEELKFIKRQSLQITADMAREVEMQLAEMQNQLDEANKTIEEQQMIINSIKNTEKEEKSKYVNLKDQYEKVLNNKTDDENLKVGVKALISIVNDLEKENEDAVVFFNEAGEEIRSLKEKIKLERKDNNVMANEMGQEIVYLNQQINDYKNEIDRLNELVKNNNTSNVVTSRNPKIDSQLYKYINDIQTDLQNIKLNSNNNNNDTIDEVNSKLDKIVDILKLQDTNCNINSREAILSEKSNSQCDSESDELIKEKIEYMKKMYNDSIVTINEMGNELVKSKFEDESNKEKIDTLSDVVVKLLETVVNLENDKKSLQKSVDEYLTVINDCGEDIRKLHFNEKDLITAISESGHEICVLKQKIQEMISYQEKYMSKNGEDLMNKVATLTSRNQDLEKELTLLRKFDINNSLKKSLEEGQLQSAWYEISKLRSHVDKLTQNSKQLEKELANARAEISSIIVTRDEALITQQEAVENSEILERSYVQQMHHLRNEVYRVYSARPTEANNYIVNLVNEMQMIPKLNNINYENQIKNAKFKALENRIVEAEEVIDTLTRENFEYQKKLSKLNEINEKLVAKLIVQNKNSQDSSVNLSQSSTDYSNQIAAPKRTQGRTSNNVSPVYVSPVSSPEPQIHIRNTSLPTPQSSNTPTPTPIPSAKNTVETNEKLPISTITSSSSLQRSYHPHFLKVKQSIENLNKRGIKRSSSQLCEQSVIQTPELPLTSPEQPKLISNVPINSDFTIKESKEDFNKLLNYFGSIPHNKRISNIKDEYNDLKDYMSFEIQNQNQIMNAIRNNEIPFYSSDDDASTEVLVINEEDE